MILRGFCENTYFTCQRCGQKWPLSDMSWDNGLLVCNERCKDVAINGSFEYRMATEASKDRQELVPDEKLIHPVDPFTQLDTLPASAGFSS
jgi:hypothetical protein